MTDRDWPMVGVVILTYNGAAFIDGLLDSLEVQTYPRERMKVLVMDNASTDDTCIRVRSRPWVELMSLPYNLGFAAANNLGATCVNTEYLAFLNQDVICHQDWLRALVSAMDSSQSCSGAVASNMILPAAAAEYRTRDCINPLPVLYYMDVSICGYGVYRRTKGQEVVHPRIISGCAFLVRRSVIEAAGGLFDEDLRMYVEDTDLSLRLRNLGLPLCVVRASVVYHLHEGARDLSAALLCIAARAIMNRVYVYYKNMWTWEFALFFPLLVAGGPLKILSLPIHPAKKALYCIPFAFFSWGCCLLALTMLHRFSGKRRRILGHRRRSSLQHLREFLRRG